MITGKFSPQSKLSEIEPFKFATYKEFFEWYVENCEKGAIYGIMDDGYTE